jgi:chromosome segregation ATPase
MEQDMVVLSHLVHNKIAELDGKLSSMGALTDLAEQVTKNRTDIDKTVTDCKQQCETTLRQMEAIKDGSQTILRDQKYIEGFIKRVLKDEEQRGPFLMRVAKIEEDHRRLNSMEEKINGLKSRVEDIQQGCAASAQNSTRILGVSAEAMLEVNRNGSEITRLQEDIATLQAQMDLALQRSVTGVDSTLNAAQVITLLQDQFAAESKEIDGKFKEHMLALTDIKADIDAILTRAGATNGGPVTYEQLDEHVRQELDRLVETKAAELASLLLQCTMRVNNSLLIEFPPGKIQIKQQMTCKHWPKD